MKACRNCKCIFTEGHKCPACGSEDVTDKHGGRILVIDPEHSEIAKQINAKIPGNYAVRVR